MRTAQPESHGKGTPHGDGLPEMLMAVGASVALGAAALVALGALAPVLELGAVATTAAGSVALYGALLAGIGVAVTVRRRGLASVGLVRTSARWIALGIGFGLLGRAVTLVVSPLYVLITGDTGNPQQGLFGDLLESSALQIILLAVSIGLLVPLAEELFFRGMLYNWLRRWGIVLAALVSASVFGIFHGVNLMLPATFALGLLNAVAYQRSGSIWPAVISHATYNGISLVALLALSQMAVPGA